MFRARAANVLKVGHVPKNSTMPRAETIEEATASCLHASPGTRTPQNDMAAATNPIDRTQKMLATVVATEAASEGNGHDRARSQEPVETTRPWATSAPSAPHMTEAMKQEHSSNEELDGLGRQA